jgi:linearmycin/streptolysin S transport system permease protein
MRHFVHLVRNDLRRLFKSPSVPLIWLAFPLVLSAIEYGAFGHLSRSSTGIPKGTLLVADHDRSMASGFFLASLQRQPLSDFFGVVQLDSLARVDKRLEKNDASAALEIPRGFQDSVLAGGRIELPFTPNARETIRPQMVDSALRTFLDIGNRFLLESDDALKQLRTATRGNSEPTRDNVMAIAGSFYDVGQRVEKLGALADLDVTVARPAPKPGSPARSGDSPNFFAMFLPGLLLFSGLMVGQGFERRAFQARMLGLQRRIGASPVSRPTVILAESVTVYLAALICSGLVLLLGLLLFRIPLREPATLLLVLLGFGFFVVGLMKTIYARARSKRAAEAVGSVVTLLTTLIGGGFVPVEVYSASIRPFAASTPVGSASQAMVDALVYGRGVTTSPEHVLIAWMWGIGFLLLGLLIAWRPRSHA